MKVDKEDWTDAEIACETPAQVTSVRYGAKFDSSDCSTVVKCRDCAWRGVTYGTEHRVQAFGALRAHRADEHNIGAKR